MSSAPATDPGRAHGGEQHGAPPAPRHDPRTSNRPAVAATLVSRRKRHPRVQPFCRAHLSRGADTAGLPSDPRHHPEGERQMITSRTGESAPGAAR